MALGQTAAGEAEACSAIHSLYTLVLKTLYCTRSYAIQNAEWERENPRKKKGLAA